jgi:predicted PurR-regulated permease PerM
MRRFYNKISVNYKIRRRTMFKLNKKLTAMLLFCMIAILIIYSIHIIYQHVNQLNSYNQSNNITSYNDNIESFKGLRQTYNSQKRNLNKMKNKIWYDNKIKIKRFLKNNNII